MYSCIPCYLKNIIDIIKSNEVQKEEVKISQLFVCKNTSTKCFKNLKFKNIRLQKYKNTLRFARTVSSFFRCRTIKSDGRVARCSGYLAKRESEHIKNYAKNSA